jgi:hypothetical protein
MPNPGYGAGLNVSPAVRDYLGLGTFDATDWKFVEVRDVPPGPWRNYGDNHFVITKELPKEANQHQQPTLGPFFTIGSTKAEVVRVQGTPDSQNNYLFRYGDSEVRFQHDRVTSWLCRRTPLKARAAGPEKIPTKKLQTPAPVPSYKGRLINGRPG